MKTDSAALFQHYYKLTVVNRGKKKNFKHGFLILLNRKSYRHVSGICHWFIDVLANQVIRIYHVTIIIDLQEKGNIY